MQRRNRVKGHTDTALEPSVCKALILNSRLKLHRNISGCHINPAITLGVWLSGGMKTKRALMYMLFQVVGAIIGSLILTLLVSTGAHGGLTATGSNSFASDAMGQAFLAELAIGLTLILIHIVCIPITGTSVNPARSIGPALMEGGQAIEQLWLFIVAPFVGAAFSALVWKFLRTE
ncbi:aquaporin [Phocaeicola plebeius]|uniref:aquaporin n=1 Tax=Phocaeicola plebeius TaxID=310297 RepID=UPI00325B41EC